MAGFEITPRGETRFTEPGALFNDQGCLARGGYATQLLLSYDPKAAAASRFRLKEWDYYLVNDEHFALCLTIGDLGYLGLISASVVDLDTPTFTTTSEMTVLPMGKFKMPHTSAAGVTRFANKRVQMSFEVAEGKRLLSVDFARWRGEETLHAEVVLTDEPRDSMVIATPWAENPRAFYYNQKIVGMRAVGYFEAGNQHHDFAEGQSFGLLDWGRGAWTYDNNWFWGVAQGEQDGHLVAMNLGYGFGDTTAASENMLFVDGVAHKLGRVDFGIAPGTGGTNAAHVQDRHKLMEPWHITDDESRLDLEFSPIIDRFDFIDLKAVVSDQHQVYGRLNGFAITDDGTRLEIHDLLGSAEAVHNRY